MRCSKCDCPLVLPSEHPNNIIFKPSYCPQCSIIFMNNIKISKIVFYEQLHEDDKPNIIKNLLSIGTYVYINNKEHKLFLEQGEIIKLGHQHYRLRFISLDKKINNAQIWIPEHWVRVLPQELTRNGKHLEKK